MNYSTFHGANSVNTFNMLLDDYVADQLNEFDKEVVKAEQSYRVKDRAGQIYLTTFIYSYAREKEIHIERKFTDMLGELRLHNALYAVGYKREQTADADLDFTSDKRWYVNFISTIF